jgi:hypothetical protein
VALRWRAALAGDEALGVELIGDLFVPAKPGADVDPSKPIAVKSVLGRASRRLP